MCRYVFVCVDMCVFVDMCLYVCAHVCTWSADRDNRLFLGHYLPCFLEMGVSLARLEMNEYSILGDQDMIGIHLSAILVLGSHQ